MPHYPRLVHCAHPVRRHVEPPIPLHRIRHDAEEIAQQEQHLVRVEFSPDHWEYVDARGRWYRPSMSLGGVEHVLQGYVHDVCEHSGHAVIRQGPLEVRVGLSAFECAHPPGLRVGDYVEVLWTCYEEVTGRMLPTP